MQKGAFRQSFPQSFPETPKFTSFKVITPANFYELYQSGTEFSATLFSKSSLETLPSHLQLQHLSNHSPNRRSSFSILLESPLPIRNLPNFERSTFRFCVRFPIQGRLLWGGSEARLNGSPVKSVNPESGDLKPFRIEFSFNSGEDLNPFFSFNHNHSA
jgi:hypothetical protein